MSKEAIYDAQIAPLMNQIIAICQENKIGMVADFAIEDDSGSDSCLHVTTCLCDESGRLLPLHAKVMRLLKPSAPMLMLATRDADGSQTLTAFI